MSGCGDMIKTSFQITKLYELDQISDFIPFPTLTITTNGTLTAACKWSNGQCRTLIYALQYLQTTYPGGSLISRSARQWNTSMTTEPIVWEKQDLWYWTASTVRYNLSLTATHDSDEKAIFTIENESRLKLERMNLILKSKHFAAKVTSEEGSLVMDNSTISCASVTTVSPIWSVGISIGFNNVTFQPFLKASIATLSAPLVHFAPQPSEQDELRSESFEMTESIFINLTFEGTTMIEVETTGDVTFTTRTFTNVKLNQQEGEYLTLKGQNFKTQLKPEQWDEDLQTKQHLTSLWGEDISMDESEKWRRGSLVYWLVSPSSEVVIGEDEDAVDHPNCGSSTFKCTTLDSAFSSAGLNTIDTISLSVSTTLSTPLFFLSSLSLKSSSEESQTITFDVSSLLIVNNPMKTLSLTSLIFTIAASCSSATLFVVEKGEMKFSSCLIGSSEISSPLIVPASTTKLIEVKSDGKLSLIDILIQHIKFTHATLGTVLHLHADSTNSFSGTSTVREITSHGRGSHVVISSSTGLDSESISSLASQIEAWGPTTTNGVRFTQSEIDEFVVIDSTGEVEELIYRWNPYDSKTLFVDRSGGSHSKCGLSVLPCSSISDNANKVGAGESIVVSSAIIVSVGFTSSKALSVESSSNTQPVLSIVNTASFTTQASPLLFTSISFIPLPQTSNQNADTTARTESLFVVESGSLSLTSCSFSSFALSSSPLITHTSGTLTLQSCSVSSITRSTGNGTVLSIEMSTGKSLLLDEIEFWSMPSSKDSPILALSFPPFDESDPDPLFYFTLTNLHFNSMTGMESQPPCFISLVGHDLTNWIEVGDDRFKNSYNQRSLFANYWSFDISNDHSQSLLVLLLPFQYQSDLFVAKRGNDETGTGSVSLPFLTLSACIKDVNSIQADLITVNIIDETRIGGCVVVGEETGTAQTIRISSTEWKGGKIVCEVEGGSVGGGRWEERRRMIAIKRSLVIVSSLTFELRGTSKQIVSVFVVSDNAELSLAECSLTTREVVTTSFVEVGSTGSLTVSDVSCSEGRFGGKGSVVVCVGSGRVEMREVEITSCWFEGGGVVVGGSTRGILIVDSQFRNCSGGSFGSLIRISVFGCSAEVQNCMFEGCTTRIRMDEIADGGRAVGGGCVVIELGHRRSSTRSAPHTSADLSMSSFVSCVLINTSPHPSSPGNLNFVGGSGFLIFVSDAGEHVDLRKVRVVDSVCEKMEGWGKGGFEGGVVVWRGQSLRLDRREMAVKGSSFGLVKEWKRLLF
ncbi:hypothetical protein BLNAU_2974 [Blattamonas nauphoetae]|uniref:Uncharacterized protein n=1 Tax=Blattamonas nauphoetae TaxID=2049346 RepID=A0ABQ9YDS9_9EUKA|nr:hypothetical protein BLNAU_2974 [Blattamonas nauphoetae]